MLKTVLHGCMQMMGFSLYPQPMGQYLDICLIQGRIFFLLLIWSWKGPERTRLFLWKLAHEVLLTNDRRLKRGLTTSEMCSVCTNHVEDHFHTFRDCVFAKEVWTCIFGFNTDGFFSQHNWVQWLYDNLTRVDMLLGAEWKVTFGVVPDNLWRRRNGIIFNNIIWSPSEVVIRVRKTVLAIKEAMDIDGKLSRNESTADNESAIRWCYPRTGEVALNCDGLVSSAGGVAACGGVVRDDMGNFIVGYTTNLGSCSILAAELWSILHGLSIAWSRGYKKTQVYSDSKTAVSLLNEGCCITNACYNLVTAIHEVRKVNGDISWKHTYREANQVADALSKFRLFLDGLIRFFDCPQPFFF